VNPVGDCADRAIVQSSESAVGDSCAPQCAVADTLSISIALQAQATAGAADSDAAQAQATAGAADSDAAAEELNKSSGAAAPGPVACAAASPPLDDSGSLPPLDVSGSRAQASVPSQTITSTTSYRQVISNRRVVLLCFALLFGNGAIALMEVVLPLYLSERLGLRVGEIGGLYAGGNALYVLLTVPAARLGVRIGRGRLIALGCALMGLSMPIMAVFPTLWWVVPLWLICSGCGMTLIDTLCRWVAAATHTYDFRHVAPDCLPHTPPVPPPESICAPPFFFCSFSVPSYLMSQKMSCPVQLGASSASRTQRSMLGL
jgi:hypothetical protein